MFKLGSGGNNSEDSIENDIHDTDEKVNEDVYDDDNNIISSTSYRNKYKDFYDELYYQEDVISTTDAKLMMNDDNRSTLSDDFMQAMKSHRNVVVVGGEVASSSLEDPSFLSSSGNLFNKKRKIIESEYFENCEYEVLEALGRGSYSNVKLCLDAQMNQFYAVKIVSHFKLKRITNGYNDMDNELAILRRLRESRAKEGSSSNEYLGQDNVVAFRESMFNNEKRKYYIILEYCLGSIHDLQEALSIDEPSASSLNASVQSHSTSKSLPDSQTHFYFIQLINGTAYLHAHGIYHLDLKPGNLLLTGNNIVKITDFGVSHMTINATSSGNCAAADALISNCRSTPAIQPPEVTTPDAPPYSALKIDVYCCGFCLYYMLCGKVPFDHASVYRIFEIISKGIYEMPSHLHDDAKLAIALLLSKRPRDRPNLDGIMKLEWVHKKWDYNRDNWVDVTILMKSSVNCEVDSKEYIVSDIHEKNNFPSTFQEEPIPTESPQEKNEAVPNVSEKKSFNRISSSNNNTKRKCTII